MEQRMASGARAWERVQELFLRALECPPAERADFVASVSGDDLELHHELTSLLESHEQTGLMDLASERGPSPEELQRMARFTARISDRYRVREEIGRGGMATVHIADDLKHRREVALKILRPEVASSLAGGHFLREIEISAKLRHPHILPLFDSGEAEGLHYFVMPLVRGESLRARLDRERSLPVEEALRIGRQVADALGYAHGQGVIHRDIKPGNILLESRHAVVSDFGIGRALDFADGARLTKTGISMGTPMYMSPEQLSAEGDADARSDLYSLSCVVFEMIAGHPPFRGETMVNLVKQHVLDRPPRLSSVVRDTPPWLSDALERGLAKKPDDRFQSAEEMLEALHGRVVPSPEPARERRLTAILSADVEGYARLMSEDETGTIRALAECHEVIGVSIRRRGGRVVDAPGDNVLAEFSSVVQAVDAAVEMQRAIAECNADREPERRMEFRIGINIGDVVVEGDRLFGDGVNVASRLQGLSDPGGICVSGDVQRQVEGKLPIDFESLGSQQLKNITKPVEVFRIRLDGHAEDRQGPSSGVPEQEIRFCTAPDGVRLGYAIAGEGPPLVKAANWLNHLEYDWQSPIWAPFLHALIEHNTLVRYDARANGLSDWDPPEVSFEAFVTDLEAVVDAAGLDRFPLLGVSQGCSVSIAYAVRHPERVSKLILYGGYARGAARRGLPGEEEAAQALITLMTQGWGQENPAYRQIFTSRFIPDATPEQVQWFNELQRMTASAENAVRIRRAINVIQVEHLLGELDVPTLVMHCRDDATVPFEEGRRLAARIRGARFVALEGKNHLIMKDDKDWPRFLDEIRAFLAE